MNQPICSLSDKRLDNLREVLIFFNSWEDQVTKSEHGIVSKHLITRETREDIHSSISGFISLCPLMIRKGNSINPGFINSNLIENMLGQQRGVRNVLNSNPTLKQYGSSNTAVVLSQCTVSKKCNSGETASFFKATTPCPLNAGRNKKVTCKHAKGIRLRENGKVINHQLNEMNYIKCVFLYCLIVLYARLLVYCCPSVCPTVCTSYDNSRRL